MLKKIRRALLVSSQITYAYAQVSTGSWQQQSSTLIDKTNFLEAKSNAMHDEWLMLADEFGSPDNPHFLTTQQDILNLLRITYKSIRQVRQTIKQMTFAISSLNDGGKKIATLKHQQQETKKEITRLTLLLYQLQNEFGEEGIIQDMKLLTKSSNISIPAAQQTHLNILIQSLQTVIEEYNNQEKNYNKIIKGNYLKKQKINAIIYEYAHTLDELEKKLNTTAGFLQIYKQTQGKLTTQRKDALMTHDQIVAHINKLTYEVNQGTFDPERDYDNAKAQLLMLRERGSDQLYPFSWPILPVSDITSHFDLHDSRTLPGIGMTTTPQQAIYATDDGLVIDIIDNPGIGSNRIIIEHDNGTTSSYIDIGETIVSLGEIVRRGQIVAFSDLFGDKPFYYLIRGTDGYSDPLTQLDLSVITTLTELPAALAWKQEIDLHKRPIDLTTITFQTGATLAERQQQFLDIYAGGVYRDREIRALAAQDHHIDPTFGICIGFAESTLGKHLSTSNNIGNVGNFDDPSIRTALASPIAGIQVIYDTLDNSLLGSYNRIDELSGYGNRNNGLPIYASSPYNRQNNVLKCLSMIHGYYVPEDYPFRTGLRTRVTNSFEVGGTLGERK